jgi:hypothetical protein
MAKNRFLLFLLFIVTAFTTFAQSPTLSGVYVGAELYTTPFQGMQINNIVVYFRSNGTFNNTLNQADWKTKVSGHYKITANTVQLAFENGEEGKKYKLAANGNLESTTGINIPYTRLKK